MMYRRFGLRLLMGASALLFPASAAACIPLMVCLPNGVCCIPDGTGPLGVFGYYFNSLFPLVLGSAAGLAVLWSLWGGIEMMMSGGDQGKRQEGISKMLHAVTGLLMIIFAAFIMNFLNPTFYQ